MRVNLIADTIESIRIGVVEEINVQGILRSSERVRDELRTQCRTANPDGENMLKLFAAAAFDFSRMDISREFFDLRVRLFDLGAQLSIGRERRFAQPIMADHSFLVRIRDSACLQVAHGRECLVDLRLHLAEEIVRKSHPADVDRKSELVVTQKVLLKPLPKRRRSHELSLN